MSFTKKRIMLPEYTGDGRKDFDALKRAINDYLQSLEAPESLTIEKARLNNSPVGDVTPNTGAFTSESSTTLKNTGVVRIEGGVGNGSFTGFSGAGLEVFNSSSVPNVQSFDRTSSLFTALAITASNWRTTSSGGVLSAGNGGIGYFTGAGGTATQLTSKATGVTLNKACGKITMNAAALAGGATVSFTLTNSAIAATDIVDVMLGSTASVTAGAYNTWSENSAAGSVVIYLKNITAGSLSEAVEIRFAVIKGVNT